MVRGELQGTGDSSGASLWAADKDALDWEKNNRTVGYIRVDRIAVLSGKIKILTGSNNVSLKCE